MPNNDWSQFITLLDYLLLPFYLVIIYLIAYRFRESKYPPGHPWRKYFLPGLFAKIGGALFIGFIYQYYYGWGDTAMYHWHAKLINSSFSESTVKWYNLLLRIPEWYEGSYSEYISKMEWYQAPAEYTVCSITAVLCIITFNTYLPTSVLLATIAFTGFWALFRTFATKFPQQTSYIAIATLFIPSTIMWGSGIFKDTICMFSLGWLTYGAFRLLINRDFGIRTILMMIVSLYLLAVIKVYILIAFLPAIVFWILASYSHKIGNALIRGLVKIGVIAICVAGFTYFMSEYSKELGRYSLEKFAKTSYLISNYIQEQSGDQGSAYNLGTIEPTAIGMFKKFPAAVNVTLFRPYIWETRKAIQVINAVEALIFLLITIKVIVSLGFMRFFRTVTSDPTLQFFLIFTLIFAFAVGISSGNFGTLSRYRIPCLPFYGMMLIFTYYKYFPADVKLFSFSLLGYKRMRWIYEKT
ncbi:MAG: hypothetical protein H6551_08040 [Chitinophagales bacterium]|nr:hypothetical protein [Chitinophagaceae bacterium]MCB9065072.1 hypothetical protein [Chitinophagales bacterium]